MGRQGLGGAGAAGRSMQRSQSRSSLSASFEALAGYFPCMNSLEEEDGGETLAGVSVCLLRLGESMFVGLAGGGSSKQQCVLTPSALEDRAGGQRPPERARGAEKFCSLVTWKASRAGADLGNGFPSKVEL